MVDTELISAGFDVLRSRDVDNGIHHVLAARNGIRVSMLEYPETLSIFADSRKMLLRAVLVPSEPFDEEAWEDAPVYFAEDVRSLCAWLTEQTE